MTTNPCGQPHYRYTESVCTEPAGHYQRERDPHAGPLIIGGPMPIQPGQTYRHCDPRESIRIRITAYRPGDARAHVVDAATGKRARQILVTHLHESATTHDGKPRRSGYALEQQ